MDLLDKSVILRILSETNMSEEKNRRAQSYNAYQVYSGNQETYVLDELKKLRPKSYSGYTLSNISISNMVINKRAQSYNEDPIRTVDGQETKTESLHDIYIDADAQKNMQFFDVIYNLNRYALMWVNYLKDETSESGKWQLQTLHPHQAPIVRDKDTGELLIVGLNYPNRDITNDAMNGDYYGPRLGAGKGDGLSDLISENQSDSAADSEIWVFWSKDQHVKVRFEQKTEVVDGIKQLKTNIDYLTIEGNPNMVNPLGVLPFIYMSEDTSIDYPTVNPITTQSITYNVLQSETLSAKNLHGSGVATLKYPSSLQGKLDVMQHGLMSMVELPQEEDQPATEFEYHTSGSQLIPMHDIDKSYLMQVFQEHGIENVKMENNVDAMNGISRAIASASVQKVIQKNQQAYTKLEKKMFKIIKAWDSFLGFNKFNEDDELQIIFPKPKVMVSDKETLENIKLMLELGLIEEWEKYIKMDPNLSEEEARKKLERVNAEKEKKAKVFMGVMDANKQEGIDQDSEAGSEGPFGNGQA